MWVGNGAAVGVDLGMCGEEKGGDEEDMLLNGIYTVYGII